MQGAPAVIEVRGSDQPLRPRSQIVGGAVMLAIGPAVIAASSVVFVDANQQIASMRAVEYAMGGVMSAAGAAIAIGGGVTLRKGILRRREEAEMGLALGPGRLTFRLRF